MKHYEFHFRYKTHPNGDTTTEWWSSAVGENLEDALKHYDFWQQNAWECADNLEFLDIKEEDYHGSGNPFALENSIKKAFAHPMKTINAIMKSNVMDDDDKKDLVFAVLANQPWRFDDLDTIVRDWFCYIMSKLK